MKRRLPALFIGHGSPLNALLDNPFTRTMTALGRELPKPEAVLCVSAHWLTGRELHLNGAKPFETIHDFSGFPDELYSVTYQPAPALEAVRRAAVLLGTAPAIEGRGLDHGAWTILRMLYPQAEVPVFQLSVAYPGEGAFHYELGRRLAPLRDEGILIIGSGNIVHNLRLAAPEIDAPPLDWNLEFYLTVKEYINKGRRPQLADYAALPGGRLSVPTPDHYWPFLVALGAGGEDPSSYPYEGYQYASLSMRAVRFG